MTAQEIFDKVINHLLQQGGPALNYNYDDDPVCRYRSNNGLKCAVGCLIPDDQYDPLMEEIRIRIHYPPTDPLNTWVAKHYEPHRDLLTALQSLHDRFGLGGVCYDWQTVILRGAADIAKKFGLAMPRTQP
jgi:hypothetical protein